MVSRESNRLTARTDKLYQFFLCQDEGRVERHLTSEEMRSKRRCGVMKEGERQWAPMNDKESSEPVNSSQSHGHSVLVAAV